MKTFFKTLAMVAAALAALACAKEADRTEEVPCVLTAAIGELPTKATPDLEGKLTWEDGDQIAVYTTEERLVTFTLSSGAGSAKASFTGTLNEGEVPNDYAIYPAAGSSYDGTTMGITLPDGYDFTEGGRVQPPMVAKISGSSLSFKHVCGMIRVSFEGFPSAAARFRYAVTNKRITGAFEVDLSGTDPVVNAVAATESAVLFNATAPGVPGTKTWFDVIVPVGTYDNASLILNATGDALSFINGLSSSKSNTVGRGSLLRMPAINMKLTDANFEKGAIGANEGTYETQYPGKYTVVDNPHKTGVNGSGKVLKADLSAETGTILSHNIQWPCTQQNGNSFSQPYRTGIYPRSNLNSLVVRCKYWCGSDKGKYIPYARAVASGSYQLPATINGTACTAENLATLLKADEWNILEWTYSQWGAAFSNGIAFRPWCDKDGNETAEAGGRIAYFDDIEVLI